MEWLGSNGIPFAIIFTKADKLKPGAIEKNVKAYIMELLASVWEEAPPYFITSSSKHLGKIALLNYIEEINQSLNPNDLID